jgi:hypothetical protein
MNTDYKKATLKNGSPDEVYTVRVADPDNKHYGFLYEKGMVLLYKKINAASIGRMEEYDRVFVDANTLNFIEDSSPEE